MVIWDLEFAICYFQSTFGALESILYIFDLSLVSELCYCHDVEVHFTIHWQMAVLQPDDCRVADSALFTADNRVLGQPEIPASSILDFNKTKGLVPTHDDIDLAQGAPEIMVYNIVFLLSQVFPGDFLAEFPN